MTCNVDCHGGLTCGVVMEQSCEVDLQELASHSPFGLNLTEETALVCPANVNFTE